MAAVTAPQPRYRFRGPQGPRGLNRNSFERLAAGGELSLYGGLPDADPPSETIPCNFMSEWSERASESLEDRIDATSDGEAEWTVFHEPTEAVRALLCRIKDRRDARITEQYFSSEGEETLQSIGDRLGLGRERVRQLIQRGLQNISVALEVEREAVRRQLEAEEKHRAAEQNIRRGREAVAAQREREAAEREARHKHETVERDARIARVMAALGTRLKREEVAAQKARRRTKCKVRRIAVLLIQDQVRERWAPVIFAADALRCARAQLAAQPAVPAVVAAHLEAEIAYEKALADKRRLDRR